MAKKIIKMIKHKDTYEKPVITKHDNLKDVTFECADWQCSITVPPPL